MKTLALLSAALLLVTTSCSSAHKSGTNSSVRPQPIEAALKVSGVGGKLRAKLTITNNTRQEVVLKNVDARAIKVETNDGKAMPPKPGLKIPEGQALHVAAGQSVETTFNLNDNYAFWDRLTKYHIWFENPQLKSNVAQVWF